MAADFRIEFDETFPERILAYQACSPRPGGPLEGIASGIRHGADALPASRGNGQARKHVGNNAKLIADLRLVERLKALLEGRSSLIGRLRRVTCLALLGVDEQVLFQKTSDEGDFELQVRLRVPNWLKPAHLEKVLTHELLHIEDKSDPSFEFNSPGSTGGAVLSRRSIMGRRFELAWCAWVDRRLTRMAQPILLSPGAYARQWDALSPGKVAVRLEDVLAHWESGPRPTHAALLHLAREPDLALPARRAGAAGTCPLCGFLVARWAESRSMTDELTEFIGRDLPGWSLRAGCCPKCVEGYEGRLHNGQVPRVD